VLKHRIAQNKPLAPHRPERKWCRLFAIEIKAAYEEEILPIVLSLGEHTEVLIPKSSRENLLALARQLADRYS
jgi:predicted DNA-binding transcriptional regulator YafY